MTLFIDPESVRLVLDGAYERLQAMQLRADDPRRVAFEEIAAAVNWRWIPEETAVCSPDYRTDRL